jgi:RNA polymerase sigma factor (sigma-70 family)
MHVQMHDQKVAAAGASGAETVDVRTDAVLTVAVRGGDLAAYGVLYERYLGLARRVAASWVTSRVEREDVIAEAFILVLRALRSGGGPHELFRPYLLATMRNALISWRRRESRVSLVTTCRTTRRRCRKERCDGGATTHLAGRERVRYLAGAVAPRVVAHRDRGDVTITDRAAARDDTERSVGTGLPGAGGPAEGLPGPALLTGVSLAVAKVVRPPCYQR